MKAIIKIFILSMVISSGTWIGAQKASAQVSVSFQVFYDNLSPHGNWVDYPDYGYVWVPNVSPGFTPYGSNGHWVFTNYGWTWVSSYSWGWAPFHYGRWFSDPMYGYMWVPGNEWGPGWVSWRQSEGYYGWAPIGPGISIELAYSSGYNIPNDRWIFVGARDFGRTNINNYYVDRSNNTTIINNTTVINNVQSDGAAGARYNAGPDRGQVQSRTGNAIKPVALKESNKPGQSMSNGELQTYRPRVEKGNAKPSRITDIKEVKPTSQRSEGVQPQKERQPNKEQPAKQQRKEQPAKQQPAKQRKEQPAKQQQQPKREQPAKQQPSQQQQNSQPNKEQPAQPKRDAQPAKQQAPQQQPSQPKSQPGKTQPSRQQRNDQPAQHQPSQQQQQSAPSPNKKEGKQPRYNMYK